MFCPKCGQQNLEGAKFCGKCGTSLIGTSPLQPTTKTVTPPQETIRYASFLERLAAAIIDGVIMATGGGLLGGMIGTSLAVFLYGIFRASPSLVHSITGGIGWILGSGLGIIYQVGMTGKYGATLGKMALKLKVVTADLQPIDYGKAALRELVGKFFSIWIFGLGYLWVLWDGKKQGWHDKIAGTVVIKTK